MKRIPVVLRITEGQVEVKGFLIAPGLAVTPRLEGTQIAKGGGWEITHILSGCAIGPPLTPPLSFAAARVAARRLAALGDWNRPGKQLSDLGLEPLAVLEALGEAGVKTVSHQKDDGDAQ